jgi:hypothetical protein
MSVVNSIKVSNASIHIPFISEEANQIKSRAHAAGQKTMADSRLPGAEYVEAKPRRSCTKRRPPCFSTIEKLDYQRALNLKINSFPEVPLPILGQNHAWITGIDFGLHNVLTYNMVRVNSNSLVDSRRSREAAAAAHLLGREEVAHVSGQIRHEINIDANENLNEEGDEDEDVRGFEDEDEDEVKQDYLFYIYIVILSNLSHG